jgi:hemoglobin
MSDTTLTPALLEAQVRAFYGTAREDPLLGPVFARIEDWEHHIARISAFWCNVVLGTRDYRGNPMGAHLPLGLTGAHFTRWLELWEETATRLLPPEGADLLIDRAHRIAASLQHGIAFAQGILPRTRPQGGQA